MAAPLDFDPDRLQQYPARLPELDGRMRVERIGGGQSNPTYRLKFASQDAILRKQPSGELLPSAHAVDREFRVQHALAATDVPVPRMLHLCEDRAVIGTLFYVMEALDGRVVQESGIPGVGRSERAAMYDAMNDVLARLHKVDWRALGLEGSAGPAIISHAKLRAGPALARVKDPRDSGAGPPGRLAAGPRSGG